MSHSLYTRLYSSRIRSDLITKKKLENKIFLPSVFVIGFAVGNDSGAEHSKELDYRLLFVSGKPVSNTVEFTHKKLVKLDVCKLH